MIFLETSRALNKTDIVQIEKELGLVFPEDFVQHYLRFNGGYPQPDVYKWPGGESTTVNTFYSLKYDGFGKIEDTYKNLVLAEQYLPPWLVVFAVDDGGNFFSVSVRQDDFGKVYYVNNDQFDLTKPEAAITLLENSFSDFISQLSGKGKN